MKKLFLLSLLIFIGLSGHAQKGNMYLLMESAPMYNNENDSEEKWARVLRVNRKDRMGNNIKSKDSVAVFKKEYKRSYVTYYAYDLLGRLVEIKGWVDNDKIYFTDKSPEKQVSKSEGIKKVITYQGLFVYKYSSCNKRVGVLILGETFYILDEGANAKRIKYISKQGDTQKDKYGWVLNKELKYATRSPGEVIPERLYKVISINVYYSENSPKVKYELNRNDTINIISMSHKRAHIQKDSYDDGWMDYNDFVPLLREEEKPIYARTDLDKDEKDQMYKDSVFYKDWVDSWGKEVADKIYNEKIWIGMNSDMARASKGNNYRLIKKTLIGEWTKHVEWWYYTDKLGKTILSLYFENDILKKISRE